MLVICIYFIKEIVFLLHTFGLLTFRSFDSKMMEYSPINFDFLHHCTFKLPNFGQFISGMATLPCAFEMRKGVRSSVTKEYFTPNQNVNMPINTNYSCSNICGTQNRCRISGEQCTSDVDCFGCQPKKFYKNGVIHSSSDEKNGYTWVLGGTNIFYPDNKRHHIEGFSPAPPEYNKGVNTWRSVFDIGMNLYKKRYEPKGLPLELNYSSEYTLSGEFIQSVPVPYA
jgi:hypothetical protein